MQHKPRVESELPSDEPLDVAIVLIRAIQLIDTDQLAGIAKTLAQLRTLGLLSAIVVESSNGQTRLSLQEQASRLCEGIDTFGNPGARVHQNIFAKQHLGKHDNVSLFSTSLLVDEPKYIMQSLRKGVIPVIPSLAREDRLSTPKPAKADEVVLALTRYFTGLAFDESEDASLSGGMVYDRLKRVASVERIIVLDPCGGIPFLSRPGTCHRFVNLDQEFEKLVEAFNEIETSQQRTRKDQAQAARSHTGNLRLLKEALSLLPSTSSALITTPSAATYASPSTPGSETSKVPGSFEFDGMVETRRKQNVLVHNLLTDKPVYSASLPANRFQGTTRDDASSEAGTEATLVKRGMPITIYPDPRNGGWTPPKPGAQRLRLTDLCIDLPRLVYLIENSFGRKLDVQQYLDRVEDNLAGVIIAGAYEGGAILTWERPEGHDNHTAYTGDRFVPYLDKFAVLKSRQGSGGVADVVFNAMVQDCFPNGVCWRSRRDNPVNKWYFERSIGTNKLSDSNWTMFWTTPELNGTDARLQDYESVCRGVEPSWADNKHIMD